VQLSRRIARHWAGICRRRTALRRAQRRGLPKPAVERAGGIAERGVALVRPEGGIGADSRIERFRRIPITGKREHWLYMMVQILFACRTIGVCDGALEGCRANVPRFATEYSR
jgi:hypothetical protein